MNLPWLPVAQAELARLSGLEYDLAQKAVVIGAVYGAILLLGLLADVGLVVWVRTRRGFWRSAVSALVWRPIALAESRAVLLAVAAAYGIFALTHRPLVDACMSMGLSRPSSLIILQSVVFHWAGLAAVIVVLARRRLPWSGAFGIAIGRLPRDAGWGVVALLAAMPLLLFYTLLYHLLLAALGHQPSLQDVAFAISDETHLAVRTYFFLLAVVVAPVFEEILFRGILLPLLARRFGVYAAITAVSILFAMIHGHVPSLVTLFLLSVALSLGYLFTRSLATSMVMHAVFNAVTVTILLSVR